MSLESRVKDCLFDYNGKLELTLDDLSQVTFELLCVMIHIITTKNVTLKPNEDVVDYFNECTFNIIVLLDVPNGEELVILYCLFNLSPNYTYMIYNKRYERHTMSNRFLTTATNMGIIKYKTTLMIINMCKLYDNSSEETDKIILNYFGFNKKSARKI